MRCDRVLFEVIGMVVFLATMAVLVQWMSVSIAMTSHGPVQWGRGWDEVVEYWCGRA
jgi:hypothetical protein